MVIVFVKIGGGDRIKFTIYLKKIKKDRLVCEIFYLFIYRFKKNYADIIKDNLLLL